MNIVFAASREYMIYATVMVSSLIKNNINEKIKIFIIYYEEMGEQLNEFQDLFASSEVEIIPVKITDAVYKRTSALSSKVWNLATWYRWYLIDILPENIERALLLGMDTLICNDISDFYYQEMEEEQFLVMCPDMCNVYSETPDKHIREELNKRGIEKEKYYNADVVLIDLNKIRKKFCYEDIINDAMNAHYYCLDQDCINFKFHNNIKPADTFKYNFVPDLEVQNRQYQDQKDICIIHYAGVKQKPWKRAEETTFTKMWWDYAKKMEHSIYIKILEQSLSYAHEQIQKISFGEKKHVFIVIF